MTVEAPAANALLELLDHDTVKSLCGSLHELRGGQTILLPGAEAGVYFPITAVLSLVSTMASGDTCEVAMVGREGMVGLSGVLAASESPTSCVVQIGGTCLRVSPESARALRNSNATVREALDRYTTARLITVAQVAACNRLHSIARRLARWLLSLHDRVDGNHLKLSQQSIANSLGVHRPTIALELQRLHTSGAIVYRSRIVRIVDRARLESLACECHQVLHGEYVRLLKPLDGPQLAASPAPPDSGAAAIEALRTIAGRLLIASLDEQAARERAEASDRAKDLFLATVSHELRAPMQAILGWCAMSKLPHPPPEAFEVIERNAKAQLSLIEDLIDAARMDSKTLRITPREVDPVTVVTSAIETIRPAAEARRVSLRLNVLDQLTPVLADADRLRQVLINVLMNSVKFSPDGASVDTEISARDTSIEVRVVDHGDGIPPEVLPYVFERFRQGPDSGHNHRHGLGLGLNIARNLVELHGGTIQLASRGRGQGTTCTITLPRR